MISTKRRSPTSVTVPKTIIEQAAVILRDLPEKPKDELSLKEAMEQMHDYITAALTKGYSLEEVAQLLGHEGVDINVSSLKYYVSRIGRQKSATTKPKVRRGRATKKEAIATPDQSDIQAEAITSTDTESEAAPTQPIAASAASEDVSLEPAESAAATPAKKSPRRSSSTTTRSKTGTKGRTSAAAKSKPTSKATSTGSRRTKKTT
jgi:type IV secretory pathway VirJ component